MNKEIAIQILQENKNFICANKDTISGILGGVVELLPSKLPLQKFILKYVILPAIKKLLDLVCGDKLDKYAKNLQ
jgi:hypothetical protein